MNIFERIAEAKIRQGQAAGEAEIARGEVGGSDFEQLRRRRLALELKRDLATDRRLGRL